MGNLREKIVRSTSKDNVDTKTALVDGVYITSQSIRKETLSHIWAKYNMLPDNLTQSLGRLYDAVEEIYLPDKNDKSLFNYTHDKSSVYSRSIAEKNLTVKDGNVQRSVTETPKEAYNSWYGKPYQNRDYNNVFESSIKNEYRENLNTVYADFNKNSLQTADTKRDNVLEVSSKTEGKFQIIPSENKFDELITNIENAELKLKENKRPKKQDYYEDGKINEDKYNEALKSWKEKTGKERRKNRKNAREEIKENENILNNEYIAEPANILTKTAKLFKEDKIYSLIGRFYGDTPKFNSEPKEYIDTARSKYGNSHGRNLLKLTGTTINGYDNPYCRVWTYHHQYGTSKDKLIRPFFNKDGNVINIEDSELITTFRSKNGGKYLQDNSVLKNGFVKITPDNLGNSKYDTKRCMFSIENLAWKDVKLENELDNDQIGPNGGRIMWFPPYDLQFQESSQAQWNETNFIGRGEPIYTYTNTRRTGSLSFTLLIDHPSIMNIFDKRANKDTSENGDDNDILRFFAGCDIPTLLNIPQPTEDSNNNNSEPEGEKTVPSEEDVKEITFSVYFPNNYSGNGEYGDGADHDWVEYILKGHGVSVGNTDYTYGYEVTKNKGISSDDPLEAKVCVAENEEICYYYYRIDFRICSLLSEANYKDTKSFQLNSTRGKNTLSFLEFASLVEPDKNYSTLNEEVKKIKDIGECIVEVYGVATNQDRSNSEGLAKRRRNTLSDYITKNINKIGGTIRGEIGGDIIIEDVKGDNNVNSEVSKKGRRVDVKILYNLPATENQNGRSTETDKKNNAPENTQNKNIKKDKKEFTESDYFENLEKIDNFAYQKIKEKIKYFEPAYHSISPEGFNSRLTFLHQCTRQGHTLERNANDSSNITTTAGNMAFGRPPFCVLRIGDFINTKILIRSVNIVYQNGNGMQWDMNPEGIGVQPMFAKVTLQIEIIGGQSLDAPVSRLNNAVSFNYYANTKVYDEKASVLYNPMTKTDEKTKNNIQQPEAK